MSEQDIKFEVEVMVSPWKVAKLARKAIGSPYAVLEPSRDIKLALNEIGVAEEVEVRKFEDGRLVVAPKAGVNALRINEIVRKISAQLESRGYQMQAELIRRHLPEFLWPENFFE